MALLRLAAMLACHADKDASTCTPKRSSTSSTTRSLAIPGKVCALQCFLSAICCAHFGDHHLKRTCFAACTNMLLGLWYPAQPASGMHSTSQCSMAGFQSHQCIGANFCLFFCNCLLAYKLDSVGPQLSARLLGSCV